jgi:hypothetical protein
MFFLNYSLFVLVFTCMDGICQYLLMVSLLILNMDQGEDASIEAAVTAISRCLRNPAGTNNCSEVL